MSGSLENYLRFAWAGLAKHGQTGGIVPSQRFLVERMILPVPTAYRGEIVELGAGNGAVTLALAGRCLDARILACELNPMLAHDARNNLRAAGLSDRVHIVSDSAEHLLTKIIDRGSASPEYVISSIPLGNLGARRTVEFISLVARALAETGLYVQFQHSLLDRRRIRGFFRTMRTHLVLLNFPPAAVYYARSPLRRSQSGSSRHA